MAPSAPLGSPLRSRLLLCAKLAVSGVLLLVLARRVDWSGILARAGNAELAPVAAACGIVLLQTLLVAERWRRLARRAGVAMPLPLAIRAVFAGLFLGQFLPSTVGGDAARLWLVSRAGHPLRGAAASIILDRVAGLLGCIALILVSLPHLFRLAAPEMAWSAGAAAAALAAAIGAFLLIDLPAPAVMLRLRPLAGILALLGDIRRTLRSTTGLAAFALSVLIQLLAVAVVFLIVTALRLEVGFYDATGIVSTSILLSAVPISVNGWGVREGVMIAGFALVGIGRQDALMVSVLFGLVAMAAALPGGVLWLARWEDGRR